MAGIVNSGDEPPAEFQSLLPAWLDDGARADLASTHRFIRFQK